MSVLRAFHGDPAVKDFYLARVRAHRAADDVVRGAYGEAEGSQSGGRGCAVGCTVHSDSHAAYERELGIPQAIARLEGTLFEWMPAEAAQDWPVEFLESIPVGADLSRVVWRVLARGIEDVRQYSDATTRSSIDAVLEGVLYPLSRGEEVLPEAAGAAEAAARAAARAAWAAAGAAAWTAWAAEAAAEAAWAAWAAGAAARAAAGAAWAAGAAAWAAAGAAGEAAEAAGEAARAAKAFLWSRWIIEEMSCAPVTVAGEVIR